MIYRINLMTVMTLDELENHIEHLSLMISIAYTIGDHDQVLKLQEILSMFADEYNRKLYILQGSDPGQVAKRQVGY